jgi:predicted Rossmann fold nucleotide-binding protein DprA/Smf involved in DNA uptake
MESVERKDRVWYHLWKYVNSGREDCDQLTRACKIIEDANLEEQETLERLNETARTLARLLIDAEHVRPGGNLTQVRKALEHFKQTLTPAEYQDLRDKIRLYEQDLLSDTGGPDTVGIP